MYCKGLGVNSTLSAVAGALVIVVDASVVVLAAMAVSADCSEHALSISAALTAVVISVLRIEISLGLGPFRCFYAYSKCVVRLNSDNKNIK